MLFKLTPFIASLLILSGCLNNELASNSIDSSTDTSNPTVPNDNDSGPTRAGAALMAVGHMQSSMYSCDGGMTWEGYQSANDSLRCWDPDNGNFDCDHDETSSLGVAWGESGFMATFGWGAPGHAAITSDGQTWTEAIRPGGNITYAGVSYGNGRYFLNSRYNGMISQNGGETFQPTGNIETVPYNLRKTFFVPGGGGRFISLASSSGVVDLMISKDNGATFTHPDTLPEGCGNGSYAQSSEIIIILSERLCYSTDNGDTWVAEDLPSNQYDRIMFDGEQFRIYLNNQFLYTENSLPLNWQSQSINLIGSPGTNLRLKNVTYQKEHQRYSAHNQSWNNWYEQTEFYYSSNGIDWQRVAKEAGDAPMSPHPIRHVAKGYLNVCDQ